jgi:endonuclease-8
MPEGDTIFRAARTLNRALAGKRVVRFESVLPALTRVEHDDPVTGRDIVSVTAAGKHLLMEFSRGLVLRTHMRMNGSWHIYRPGERWRRPRHDMRVLVATEDFEAVGFNIPEAELLSAAERARHRQLRRLGPDLLGETFDEPTAISRARAEGARQIADVLIDQHVMAGLGNVYKSEVLFACRIDPFAATSGLADAQLSDLIATARRFLRVNVTPAVHPMTTYRGYRRTTGRDDPSERLWVYGRARKPCRRCGTPIRVLPQGPRVRLTYWCPVCQPAAVESRGSAPGPEDVR